MGKRKRAANGPDLSRCARCGRAYDGDAAHWNRVYVRGRAVQMLCPECQTPDEAAEAEQHARTIDYSQMKQLGSARLVSTAELREANAIAAGRGSIGLSDEAIELLDDDDEHLLVLGATHRGELTGIAACICSVAYDEDETHETTEGMSVIERFAAKADPDAGPVRGFIEIRLADFMAWREVAIDAELARVMTEGVQQYMREITERDDPADK